MCVSLSSSILASQRVLIPSHRTERGIRRASFVQALRVVNDRAQCSGYCTASAPVASHRSLGWVMRIQVRPGLISRDVHLELACRCLHCTDVRRKGEEKEDSESQRKVGRLWTLRCFPVHVLLLLPPKCLCEWGTAGDTRMLGRIRRLPQRVGMERRAAIRFRT